MVKLPSSRSSAEQVASDWIAYASNGPDDASDEVFDLAWIMYDLVNDDPALAWGAIKAVVNRYTENELYLANGSEAQRVVGNIAAGPLEDLLVKHGVRFIEIVETEARRDRRMSWMLSGVWQSGMPEHIWTRVQRAAGGVSR